MTFIRTEHGKSLHQNNLIVHIYIFTIVRKSATKNRAAHYCSTEKALLEAHCATLGLTMGTHEIVFHCARVCLYRISTLDCVLTMQSTGL